MLYVNIPADSAAIVRNEFFQLFKIIIIGADKTVIVNTGISSGGDKVYFNALVYLLRIAEYHRSKPEVPVIWNCKDIFSGVISHSVGRKHGSFYAQIFFKLGLSRYDLSAVLVELAVGYHKPLRQLLESRNAHLLNAVYLIDKGKLSAQRLFKRSLFFYLFFAAL